MTVSPAFNPILSSWTIHVGEQPSMKYIKDKDIELNDSDGYGLAMPELMRRWGEDIGADYLLPGCVLFSEFFL